MLERLLSGALWGAGATLVISLTKGEGGRPLVRNLMKGYVAVADRVGELTAEARESLRDAQAEAEAERERDVAMTAQSEPVTGRAGGT